MRLPFICLGFVIATPAGAQIWDGGGSVEQARPPIAAGVGPILNETDERIRDGRRAGQFSKREARRMRRDNDVTRDLEARYSAGGISVSEQAELQARAEAQRGLVDARRLSPPSPR